jgi:hypothetical protein
VSVKCQLLGYLKEEICLTRPAWRKRGGLRVSARFNRRGRGCRGENADVVAVREGVGGNILKVHYFGGAHGSWT